MANKISSPTRRGFLKSAAATGAGLLICDSRTAFSYQANERLNIAAIGAGGMGEGDIGAVSSETIVALCDVDERRCVSTRGRHEKAKYYKDFRRMLAEMDKEIDAVVVATPDHTHAVAAVAAMKQGKHIYCEKPLTRTVFEARVMRETAQRHKVVTQMGNQGSASEGVRRGTEWAWAGTAGPDPRSLRMGRRRQQADDTTQGHASGARRTRLGPVARNRRPSARTTPVIYQQRGVAGGISVAVDWATWVATPGTSCSAGCAWRSSGRPPQ